MRTKDSISFQHVCCLILCLLLAVLTALPSDYAINSPAMTSEGGNLNTSGLGTNSEHTWQLVLFPDSVKALECPDWLLLWEDAEFMAPSGMFADLYMGESDNTTIQRAYALASMTGGKWLTDTGIGKRSDLVDLDDIVLEYADSGDEDVLLQLYDDPEHPSPRLHQSSKRAWMNFLKRRWRRSGRHVAAATALDVLGRVFEGSCDWLVLGRSAVCAKDRDRNVGCLSWTGGWQDIPRCVAANILKSARGDFGEYNDFSAHCPNCLELVNRKRDTYAMEDENVFTNNKKRSYNKQVCVSNRPNGC